MKSQIYSIIAILSLILNACGSLSELKLQPSVSVEIIYGSEKVEWLEPLVRQYNEAQNKTSGGKTIVVEAKAMGSIESVRGIIEGTLHPTVWSPAS